LDFRGWFCRDALGHGVVEIQSSEGRGIFDRMNRIYRMGVGAQGESVLLRFTHWK
jgi:hypothetical protein